MRIFKKGFDNAQRIYQKQSSYSSGNFIDRNDYHCKTCKLASVGA